MSTSSVRLDNELIEAARRDASVFSRTVSGQIEHWVKLGQAAEKAPGWSLDRVRAALEGRFDADQLSPDEREAFYDALSDALATPSEAELAFFERRKKKGGGVGYDEQGRYVRGLPGGDVEVIEEAPANAQG